MLKKLYDSSTGLLMRFGLHPTPAQQFEVCREEVNELSEAIFEGFGDPLLEGVDVMVTVLNTLYAMGYTYADIERAVEQVIRKNDAKTAETHYINAAGKIQRIGRE